jgi:hypothetical protein
MRFGPARNKQRGEGRDRNSCGSRDSDAYQHPWASGVLTCRSLSTLENVTLL